eukprot:CAMPEP_0170579984 /NCGR_PEP_ID=MMETSP0224-20130122/6272_1 /TAXON_ID=285029 /ORGANISM="Togula jolla, Strain CCCM 725" /LENGTH=212 /DNA_ID=CAMNT_0010903039 /DNA_START=54 /DNA_END=690 /DNA_ORIENTATION=-
MAKAFANFTFPEESEGFDEIRFVWEKAERSRALLREWVLEQKKTQRVEDLEPSSWFKDRLAVWQKTLLDWKKRQNDSRGGARKSREKSASRRTGSYHVDEDMEEGEEKETAGDKAAEIDEDDLDVFGLADVNDIGNGPLYANFTYEDWTLLNLRYELHLLVHGFRHDLDDPDRQSFAKMHFLFYYNRYFHKTFNFKIFGVDSLEKVVVMIKE